MLSWSRRQEIRPSLMSRMKCLATFRLLITFPAATPILSGSFSRPAAALAAMAPRSASVAASSSWRVRARLAASNGVAAGDQPLAGEVRGADLGQVLLIEQRQLQRPVPGHELLDRGVAQAGDPCHPLQFPQVLDPRRGD